MTVTNTTSWGPNIRTEIIDPLVLAFARSAVVITPFVRYVDISGEPGLKYDFNSFGTLSFGAKTQGTDFTHAESTIVEDGTVTASEVGVSVQLPDLNVEANPAGIEEALAREIGYAAADKLESDLLSKITSATTTKGTSGAALTMAAFEEALLALREAKAPNGPQPNTNLPPALCGHLCVLAEVGVAQLGRAIRQAGASVGPVVGADVLSEFGTRANGAARFSFLGVNVFGSELIPTESSNDKGAMFCPAALGIVMKRPPRHAIQRWESGTEAHHVGSMAYGVGLIKDVWLIELQHKNSGIE